MSLLAESTKLRVAAQQLLKETDLLTLLGKYGEVELTGSYVLDLMMTPDIDIHLANPSMTKRKAIRLLNELIEGGRFRSCMLYDNAKRQEREFPKGYYIGLKRPYVDSRWKIDVWCLRKGGHNDEVMKHIQDHLDNANKLAILKLKKWKYRRAMDFSTMKIYEAVIEKRINSIGEFEKFLQSDTS